MRTSIEVIVEVEIARPRLAVWSLIADVERLPEWLGEFESASKVSEGPIGVGTVVHYTLAPGHRSGTYQPELTGTQVLLRPYLKRWLTQRRVTDTQTLKAMLEADAPRELGSARSRSDVLRRRRG